MVDSIGDTLLRTAAFERVRTLCEIHDHLTAQQLGEGFIVDGQRYPLVNPRRESSSRRKCDSYCRSTRSFRKQATACGMMTNVMSTARFSTAIRWWTTLSWATIRTPQTTVGFERPSRTKSQSSTFSGSRLDAIRPFFQPSSGDGIGHRSAPTLCSVFQDKTALRRLRRKLSVDTLCGPSNNVFIRRPSEKLLLAPTEADVLCPGSPSRASRRRSYRRRSTRGAWSACGPQRHPALENPPRGLRRSSHRNRPGFPIACFRAFARST